MYSIREIKRMVQLSGRQTLKLNGIFGISEAEINRIGGQVHCLMQKLPHKDHVGDAIYVFEQILKIKRYTPKQLLHMTFYVYMLKQTVINDLAKELAEKAVSPSQSKKS